MVDVPAEAPGSSQHTAIVTGAGAVLGALILAPVAIAAAPILLPAAAATVVMGSGAVAGAGLGALAGYLGFGKK